MELCHRLIACRPHWQGAQFSPFFVRFIPPRACATIFHFLSARDTNYNWSPSTSLLISSLRTFYTYFAPPQHLGTQREENMPSTSNDASIPSSNPPHSAAPPAFVTPSTPIAAPILLPLRLLPSLVYQPSFHPSGQVTSSLVLTVRGRVRCLPHHKPGNTVRPHRKVSSPRGRSGSSRPDCQQTYD